jgi:hypothetical protein
MYCPYCGWNKNTDFEEEAGNYDFMQLEVEENKFSDSVEDSSATKNPPKE